MLRPFAADDPPLHVVGGKLDDGDGRLGGVAGGDPLQRVGDERPRPSPRLGPGLLLLLPDATGQLVPDQILRPLEQVVLRLGDGEAGDLLELRERVVLRRLQLFLQLLDVVSRSARPCSRRVTSLVFSSSSRSDLPDPLVDLRRLGAAALDLVLDLGPERDGELAPFDLRLAPDRLGLALGDVDARAAAQHQRAPSRRLRRSRVP